MHHLAEVIAVPTGKLENEPSPEAIVFKLGKHLVPVHIALTGRQVLVTPTPVVIHMQHTQVAGKLVHGEWQIPGKISVPRVQTGPDITHLSCTHDIE